MARLVDDSENDEPRDPREGELDERGDQADGLDDDYDDDCSDDFDADELGVDPEED